ncbi:hypothetical protein GP486_000433 [Trichoglossum hirsutum]|uniref:Uncharacterized protein n=1 Tax=Trichoglossum hirsutum TaxID=265104 RepID=A0A9P8LIS7_9PEZI|nr:hypothetical protein GP486_000433 [Trichoglossum hirsutum]
MISSITSMEPLEKQTDPRFQLAIHEEVHGRLFRPSSLNPTADNPDLELDEQDYQYLSKEKQKRQGSQTPPSQPPPPRAESASADGATKAHNNQVPLETKTFITQLEIKPIGQKQPLEELKIIYAGLVTVEAKCINVDNQQARNTQDAEPGEKPKSNNGQ